MKHRINRIVATMMIMVIMTLSSSCFFTARSTEQPRHRTRHVWIHNVKYEQVYYKDGDKNTVIVSQKEVQRHHKKPKKNQGRGH